MAADWLKLPNVISGARKGADPVVTLISFDLKRFRTFNKNINTLINIPIFCL